MASRRMKAFVVRRARHGSIEDVPYPMLESSDEIIVKVHRVGICGTDQHIFDGDFISPYPIVPGHEFAGTVEEVGSQVTHLTVGDRVCVDPTLYCGGCEYCLTSRFNQCAQWGAIGDTTDGALGEYVRVPGKNAVKMPESMTFGEGAFVEPAACVVHGMNRLQLRLGDTVLVFGVGAMGLQLVQALVHAGASELVAVDVDQGKLDLALHFGATRAVLAPDVAEVIDREHPDGFDVVVDVTGSPAVIQSVFQYLGKGGKMLQFGVSPTNAEIRINPFEIYNKDWTILGSMAINNSYLSAFRLVREGRIDVTPILTKCIALDEVPEFLSTPKARGLLKVQVAMG